jgi:hypothetical protein
MKLQTTDAQLHALDVALDTTRESSRTVKVDKAALRALLADHFALNKAVQQKHGAFPETAP